MTSDRHWPTTSSRLLARMRDRQDGPSWSEFVRVYAPLVYRYCVRRGLQDADAQDVTQETLTDVARAIEAFQYDRRKGRFRGWLGAVVRHAIHRQNEKASRPGRGLGGDSHSFLLRIAGAPDDAGWADEFNAHVCRLALERVQSAVGEETWRAFQEVWLQDRKPAEVAREMNRAPEWVYRAKFRALSRLRREVAALACEDDLD